MSYGATMFLSGAILLQNAHPLSTARRQPAEYENDQLVWAAVRYQREASPGGQFG
jgi:hypothetical protein